MSTTNMASMQWSPVHETSSGSLGNDRRSNRFSFQFSTATAASGSYTTVTMSLYEFEQRCYDNRTFQLQIAATTQAAASDCGTFAHGTQDLAVVFGTITTDCDYLCQTNNSGTFSFQYGTSTTFVARGIIDGKAFESSSFTFA